MQGLFFSMELFEETKGVNLKPNKIRQYNDRKTHNDLQNTTQKTKHCNTNPTKHRLNSGAPEGYKQFLL